MNEPIVSCLMVTRDRPELVARSVDCFARQRHAARELVIIDDGDVDLRPIVEPHLEMGQRIRYHRLPARPGVLLGDLRNEAIDRARGEWCLQWDDDEWYHPDRIGAQWRAVAHAGPAAVGVVLRWTLMVVDSSRHGALAYRADAGFATPGTVLHRRDAARYPSLARAEDSAFLRDLRRAGDVAVLGREASHLFVRVYHGRNTWDEEHFLRRLHRRPVDWPSYAAARWWYRDLTRHRAFRLDPRERAAVDQLRGVPTLVAPSPTVATPSGRTP